MTKCRICGCTYARGCPGGCSWAEADLCSICYQARRMIAEYEQACLRVTKASLGRLLAETYKAWQTEPRRRAVAGGRR